MSSLDSMSGEDKNKEQLFPDKGTYHGHRYRIDGDEVMLRINNNTELGFKISSAINPQEADAHKRTIERSPFLIPAPLQPWVHPEILERIRQANLKKSQEGEVPEEVILNAASAKTSEDAAAYFEETAKLYECTTEELDNMRILAGYILAEYWRSRSKKN